MIEAQSTEEVPPPKTQGETFIDLLLAQINSIDWREYEVRVVFSGRQILHGKQIRKLNIVPANGKGK